MTTSDETGAQDAFNRFEADGWEHRAGGYHELADGLTTRVIEPLLDAAGVDHGTRVLDVATGPGYVAEGARLRGADVVGVDIAGAMVALARRLHPEIEFRQADAERLPFAAGSFDAVVGNFMILHVGRPEQAAAELTRVLDVHGAAALSTWDLPERARLLGVLVDALADVGAQPPADLPAGPPFFRFADDTEFTSLLNDAGLIDVEVQRVSFTQSFTSGDDLWKRLLDGTVRTRALVRAQPEAVQAEIRSAFDRRVRPYATDGHLHLPVSVKVASGRKPPPR